MIIPRLYEVCHVVHGLQGKRPLFGAEEVTRFGGKRKSKEVLHIHRSRQVNTVTKTYLA